MTGFALDRLLAALDDTAQSCRELLASWVGFLDGDPYPARVLPSAERGWYSVQFDFSTPVPPGIVLKLGRIADALQTILDDAARAAVEASSAVG